MQAEKMAERSQLEDGAEGDMPESVLCSHSTDDVESCESNFLEGSGGSGRMLGDRGITERMPSWESASQWHIMGDAAVVPTIVSVPSEAAAEKRSVNSVSLAKYGWESGRSMSERGVSSRDCGAPRIELDSLPMDLRVRMLRFSALVGVESMVRLGSVSKSFAQAMLELQTEDPSVLRGVRQNQRIYQEIQSQLVKERFQRNRLNLIKGWTRENECPSFWKIIFDQPGIVPYHPPYVSICCGFLLMAFSLKRLASTSLVYDQALLALLGTYGGFISFTGIFYLFCVFLDSNFLLVGLLAMFLLLMGTQVAVILLSISVYIHDESRLSCLPLILAFMVSLWTIVLHARARFETGTRRAYATGCFALSVVSVAYYLVSIG